MQAERFGLEEIEDHEGEVWLGGYKKAFDVMIDRAVAVRWQLIWKLGTGRRRLKVVILCCCVDINVGKERRREKKGLGANI